MKTILNASLSASGSPSEVKQRIGDQVAATGTASPEQSQALGAARAFIEKTIAGVSEDDTLSVSATITVSVMDAPPVLVAKIAAAEDKATAAQSTAASLVKQLADAKTALEDTRKKLHDAQTNVTEPHVGV